MTQTPLTLPTPQWCPILMAKTQRRFLPDTDLGPIHERAESTSLLLAMFYNIFDTVPERPVGNTDNLYFVLDEGSLIHSVVWPKQDTFG
ncbi:hypothetical protein AVEN_73070-1 [Araneus ventricosus]|uniref:Uncharacterized protein n=1 Tax=Araneus ventricosus TaxID=182803 RepID=A0A4Y2QZL0_ARAVE|nr:hypothetical protein AVEN_73070-1 [Araneus ventricosus]